MVWNYSHWSSSFFLGSESVLPLPLAIGSNREGSLRLTVIVEAVEDEDDFPGVPLDELLPVDEPWPPEANTVTSGFSGGCFWCLGLLCTVGWGWWGCDPRMSGSLAANVPIISSSLAILRSSFSRLVLTSFMESSTKTGGSGVRAEWLWLSFHFTDFQSSLPGKPWWLFLLQHGQQSNASYTWICHAWGYRTLALP